MDGGFSYRCYCSCPVQNRRSRLSINAVFRRNALWRATVHYVMALLPALSWNVLRANRWFALPVASWDDLTTNFTLDILLDGTSDGRPCPTTDYTKDNNIAATCTKTVLASMTCRPHPAANHGHVDDNISKAEIEPKHSKCRTVRKTKPIPLGRGRASRWTKCCFTQSVNFKNHNHKDQALYHPPPSS